MNKKVVLFIAMGILGYVAFATSVLTFVKDDSNQMHWEDREAFNRKYINQLSISTPLNRQQVIDNLSAPDITEAKKVGDEIYQLLFYRTHRIKSDGYTTKDECTPLLFQNNMLIAIGTSALQQYKAK